MKDRTPEKLIVQKRYFSSIICFFDNIQLQLTLINSTN